MCYYTHTYNAHTGQTMPKSALQKSFETVMSHDEFLRKRSFKWYIDDYDDMVVDAAWRGYKAATEGAQHVFNHSKDMIEHMRDMEERLRIAEKKLLTYELHLV